MMAPFTEEHRDRAERRRTARPVALVESQSAFSDPVFVGSLVTAALLGIATWAMAALQLFPAF